MRTAVISCLNKLVSRQDASFSWSPVVIHRQSHRTRVITTTWTHLLTIWAILINLFYLVVPRPLCSLHILVVFICWVCIVCMMTRLWESCKGSWECLYMVLWKTSRALVHFDAEIEVAKVWKIKGLSFFCVKTYKSCTFGPTVQMDPAFSVPANTLFWNQIPGGKMAPSIFVLGFVRHQIRKTMTTPPPQWATFDFRLICFDILFVVFNTAPW